MIAVRALDLDCPVVTAGDIAVNNLESARRQSWSRFWQDPQRPGIAEYIVEQEQFMAQYVGDLGALERLDGLVDQLDRVCADEMRTALIRAQVASMGHRFEEARSYLAQAVAHGAPQADVNRLMLSIDQACGTNLESVLEARRKMAAESERLEDLVPLGGLLADLREFEEADSVYLRALSSYEDVSPFAVAWVCFQLGALWGELVPEPQPERAATLVSKSHRIFAVLRQSARALVGDLSGIWECCRCRSPTDSSGFKWRSGSELASCRCAGSDGKTYGIGSADAGRAVRLRDSAR